MLCSTPVLSPSLLSESIPLVRVRPSCPSPSLLSESVPLFRVHPWDYPSQILGPGTALLGLHYPQIIGPRDTVRIPSQACRPAEFLNKPSLIRIPHQQLVTDGYASASALEAPSAMASPASPAFSSSPISTAPCMPFLTDSNNLSPARQPTAAAAADGDDDYTAAAGAAASACAQPRCSRPALRLPASYASTASASAARAGPEACVTHERPP
jgi:hypothetical protein